RAAGGRPGPALAGARPQPPGPPDMAAARRRRHRDEDPPTSVTPACIPAYDAAREPSAPLWEVYTVKRVVIGAAAPFLALACGGPAASTNPAAHAPVTFTVRAMPTADLGPILVDARGKTLEFFMSENRRP